MQRGGDQHESNRHFPLLNRIHVRYPVPMQVILFSWCALSTLSAADTDDARRVLVMPWSVTGGAHIAENRILDDLLVEAVTHALPEDHVIGMADLNTTLELELTKDLLGCDDVRCTAEIGRALDADLIVKGVLGTLGGKVVAILKMIDAKDARVVRRITESMLIDGDVVHLVRTVVDALTPRHRALGPVWAGQSHADWSNEVRGLAYGPLSCSGAIQCTELYRNNAASIRHLLNHRDQPGVVLLHREALQNRLAELKSLLEKSPGRSTKQRNRSRRSVRHNTNRPSRARDRAHWVNHLSTDDLQKLVSAHTRKSGRAD